MNINSDVKEKKQTQSKSRVKPDRKLSLILMNDDVNTFDHVIDCLIDICDHAPEQAEQCALITHTRGSCSVKEGTREKLNPLRSQLQERGLTAEIH